MYLDYPNTSSVQSLYICARQHFLPKYKIRRAVEEDNDDIVPMIDKYSSLIKEMYGEFYIAELLTKYDTGRHIIVAEYNEEAVAVMILNDEVNYDLLNDNFELVPYNGLRKPHDEDEIHADSNFAKGDLE